MVVADGDRVGVAQRARRDLRDRPRADAPHGEQPAARLLERQVRALLQPARHRRGAQHRARPGPPRRRPVASPRPGPRARPRPSAAPAACAEPGRARACRAAAPAGATPPWRRARPPSARGPPGRAPRTRCPTAGSAAPCRRAVRLADDRVQRRVEARAGRRARPAGRATPASARSAPGPHAVTWTPSRADDQVARGGTVRRRRRLPDRPVRGEPPRRVAAAAPQRTERQPDVDAVARPVDRRQRPSARRPARWSRPPLCAGRDSPMPTGTGPPTHWVHDHPHRHLRLALRRRGARCSTPPALPQRRELEYASRRLTSIEINGSFYALQRPESYVAWAAETPDDFVFSVKGPRFVTHMKKLADVRVPVANFFASGVLALGPKLGPILWQLPPNLGFHPRPARRVLRPPAAHHGRRGAAGHRARRAPGRPGLDHDRRRPAPAARAGGPARELRGPRVRRAAARARHRPGRRRRRRSVAGDRGRDGRPGVRAAARRDRAVRQRVRRRRARPVGGEDPRVGGRRRTGGSAHARRPGRSRRRSGTCSSTSTTTSRSAPRTTRWRSRRGWA